MSVNTSEESTKIYHSFNKGFVFRLTILSSIIFFATLAFNIPTTQLIENKVRTVLKTQLRSCPISFSRLETEIFPPRIKFVSPVINGACFKKVGQYIHLDDFKLTFLSPTLTSLGIRFKAQTALKGKKTKFVFYPSVTLGGYNLKVENTKINLNDISEYIGAQLRGTLTINARVEGSRSKSSPDSIDVLVESNDFNLPPMEVDAMALQLPEMKFGKLFVKASMKKGQKEVELIQAVLGNAKAPIQSSFDGNVTLQKYGLRSAILDLKGKFQFSEKFLEEFSMISSILKFKGAKADQEGFYHIKVGGTPARPTHSFL